MSLERLLPQDGLPFGNGPPNAELSWWGQDNAEEYARRGHPIYSDRDITYRFNRWGYRSIDFGTQAPLRIISVGCSWVFGHAVRHEDIFHEIVASQLGTLVGTNVANYNFGASGNSNDAIARTLHLAVPALQPDLVLVLFTHLGRREYIAPNDYAIKYNPGWKTDDRIYREVASHFEELTSEPDDLLNFYRNFKSVSSLLHDRPWIFGAIEGEKIKSLGGHIDSTRQAFIAKYTDRGRDNSHPGPNSHRAMAQSFWERLLAVAPTEIEQWRLRARRERHAEAARSILARRSFDALQGSARERRDAQDANGLGEPFDR